MTWKSYSVVSGAGLLATWLVSTPTLPPERPSAPAPAVTTAQPSGDIAEQADRLRARVRPETPYLEPSRNPFRFGSRSGRMPRATSSEPVAREQVPEQPVAPPPPPEPPAIRLTGIATENVAGTRRRTAVLVTVQGIVTVREGDPVGTEYRVSRIEDSAVELVGTDGSTRRLPLRQ